MKKVVFAALMVTFFLSLVIAYEETKSMALEKMDTLEEEIATPFVIPAKDLLADPEEMYPILRETAAQSEVNLFRKGYHFRPDDQVEMIKYVLLTGETHFFDHVQLDSGRILQAKETQNSGRFLSSTQTQDKNQVGQIHHFDPGQLITIQPLKVSYESLPVEGRYYVEAENHAQFQLFLKRLSEKINTYFKSTYGYEDVSYTPADFQPEPAATTEKMHSSSMLDFYPYIQYLLFLITIMLLIYYTFNMAKQVGILKMHGVTNLRIWWRIVGRLISMAVVVAALGGALLVLALRAPAFFLYQSLLHLGQAYLILILLSLLCYVYMSTIQVSQTIKNRKDTRSIYVFNMVWKGICALILMGIGLSAMEQYAQIRDRQEQLDHWAHTKDYGVLYPVYIGNSTATTLEERQKEDAKNAEAMSQLYPTLNGQGALYIDASEYEEMHLLLNRNFGGIRSIMVNPNYLKVFPVNDSEGHPVQVSEKSKDWVLLVPEQYKNREKEIRDYFESKEQRDFYVSVDKGQKLKILWLAEGQRIFSFNPDVFPAEQNMITDPIIHVKTENNHLFGYSGGIRGGGARDPLKVKLIDRDTALTYKKLSPKLKRLKVDDNLKRIQTVDQYVLEELRDLQQGMNITMLIMLGLAVSFLFLIVQNLLIFFHKHQQRFVVHRLFGIGFFRTYRTYFRWLIITWIALVVLGWVVNQVLGLGLVQGITDPRFPMVVLSFLGIELFASVIALILIERRNKIQVIKGGE
ncbi:hypothetical protein GCM10007416_23320 [Kroppenstedtia guangzhouensis]|uniref:Bacteriocin-associated integral membrane (Putative immunity) protein n=1 Tax=Kroppenstedtia guangzhouensis TaxID=1274356 RepID=A0ABQ1GSI1_9BACL|nr:DUF1430 domain-containing protein [Kroppenstedtia guangzhouensis]GGA49565.1 hypothetical protein GCM10007416_23320 [Kroppenstedtia guangzhouensis]